MHFFYVQGSILKHALHIKYYFSFFASPKKERKKGAHFAEVFFRLICRTPKNHLISAKFLPRLQKFLTH